MEQSHLELKQQPGERGHLHRAEVFSPRLACCPPSLDEQAIRHAGTFPGSPTAGMTATSCWGAVGASPLWRWLAPRVPGARRAPCSLETFQWPTGGN